MKTKVDNLHAYPLNEVESGRRLKMLKFGRRLTVLMNYVILLTNGSQESFADMIGISESNLSRLLSGRAYPSYRVLANIREVMTDLMRVDVENRRYMCNTLFLGLFD